MCVARAVRGDIEHQDPGSTETLSSTHPEPPLSLHKERKIYKAAAAPLLIPGKDERIAAGLICCPPCLRTSAPSASLDLLKARLALLRTPEQHLSGAGRRTVA